MRRILTSLFTPALMLTLFPVWATAQEVEPAVFIDAYFTVILDVDLAASQGIFGITDAGEAIELGEGHTPIEGGSLVVDFSEARGPIDDSNDGADTGLDILGAWGNVVHVSKPASAYFAQNFNENIVLPPGFFSAHDGTAPAFPEESVVVGIEADEPIAEELGPELHLKFQLSWTFTRAGEPVSESNDVNGGHNGSIDAWSNGTAGTDAYDFPSGIFSRRSTEFFGWAQGNRLMLAGPWTEVDGADGFVLNIVDGFAFDAADLGDLSEFGTIRVDLWSEQDLNGDGVVDSFETAETTTEQEPTEEPSTEEPTVVSDAEQTSPSTADSGTAAPVPISAESDSGGIAWIFILMALILVGGGFGFWMVLKRGNAGKCVPEAEALAAAEARVGEKEAAVEKGKVAVEKARDHLTYTEANASEQRELRLVEAQQAVDKAESDLRLAEGSLSDARAERDAATYAYDVCMGFATPEPEPQSEPQAGPAPVVSPPSQDHPEPPPPADTGPGQPAVIDDDASTSTATPPPPPPPRKAECEDGRTREIEESSGSFSVAVDGTVRLTLSTGEGPLDDLEDMVSGTSIADMITDQVAEFLTPDSLSVSASSLSAGTARSWQSGLEKMAGAARTDIEVVIEYDLEDVSLACIRLEACQGGHWVTVGHRLEERERTQRTVTARWETVSSDRPLGATFTSVRRGLENASAERANMDTFSSNCN